MDVINNVLKANDILGITNLVVDALDQDTAKFYQDLSFQGSPDADLRLYLPIASIRKLLQRTNVR